MQARIPQFQPYFDEQEYIAIKQCFDSNWITEGPKSKEFVEKLCELMNVEYGVLAPNGTLSLYMALRALGIGCGDEVLVPNFTFIASANAVEMCGAKPVFVDINEDLHINIDMAKKLVNKKTKAIMPVHIYGMACDMEQIVSFAEAHKLKIIEDAAQGIGITWNNKHVGTYGDIGSFSFFADKTITTGEGGLLVTNSKETYEALLYIRNQGRIDRGSFIHPEIGYNFRMTDIQSAIGLVQLKKLSTIINKKACILKTYQENLDSRYKIITPKNDKSNHIPFRVCTTVSGGSEGLMNHLKENNIETRTFFYPLHMQPCFSNLKKSSKASFDISITKYKEGVCLPSFVGITNEQILYVCEKMNEYIQR